MKKNLYLGLIVVGILVLFLTLIGVYLDKKNGAYYELEDQITTSAKKYLAQYPDYFPEKELILTKEKLQEANFLNDLRYKEDNCNGYVIVSKLYFHYKYESFIKCENYQTNKINLEIIGE